VKLQIKIEIEGSFADLAGDGYDETVEVGFYFYQPDGVVVECPAISLPKFADVESEEEVIENDAQPDGNAVDRDDDENQTRNQPKNRTS